MVALQAGVALDPSASSWRIAATGVVLEQEAELRVVKKLKLVGAPFKARREQLSRVCFSGTGSPSQPLIPPTHPPTHPPTTPPIHPPTNPP